MAWSDRACIVKVGHVIKIIMSPFDDSLMKMRVIYHIVILCLVRFSIKTGHYEKF